MQKGEISEDKLKGGQQEELLSLFGFTLLKVGEFLSPNVVEQEGRNHLPNLS